MDGRRRPRVRFDAPVADCIATAKAILGNYNAANPGDKIPGLTEFDNTHSSELADPNDIASGELVTPWFHPEQIKKGQIGGELGSFTPQVWIDTDKGVFYYRYED
jgi:hypothetical protein